MEDALKYRIHDRLTPERRARLEERIAIRKQRERVLAERRAQEARIRERNQSTLCAVYGCEREAEEEADPDWGCEPNRIADFDGSSYSWSAVCSPCAREYEFMVAEINRH